MTGIPKLTAQTRPAIEFGHRYLAQPLIVAIQLRTEQACEALDRGDVASARQLLAQLREAADLQDQCTRTLLALQG